MTGLPDHIIIEITGGDSAFKKGDNVSISSEIELKKFESLVAFYNGPDVSSSMNFNMLISKIAFLVLIAVCVFVNFEF